MYWRIDDASESCVDFRKGSDRMLDLPPSCQRRGAVGNCPRVVLYSRCHLEICSGAPQRVWECPQVRRGFGGVRGSTDVIRHWALKRGSVAPAWDDCLAGYFARSTTATQANWTPPHIKRPPLQITLRPTCQVSGHLLASASALSPGTGHFLSVGTNS